MGRKSSAKGQGPVPPTPPVGPRTQQNRSKPLVWAGILIVLVAVGLLALRPSAEPEAADSVSSAAAAPGAAAEPQGPQPTAAAQARADATAKLGPRPQKQLPPIPFRGYAPPRPTDVVVAAYQFAAEHPEILSYVPCFCGCEQAGHQGNHDCFVKTRDANGDVTEWDEHGVECTVCIDVANRSRQLFASGASARDIRTAIEKEYAASPSKMATPHPPGHTH